MNGTRAVVTRHHWSCGDGCCSDTDYSAVIYAMENYVAEVDKNLFISEDGIVDHLKETYGKDIQIDFDDDYSGDVANEETNYDNL